MTFNFTNTTPAASEAPAQSQPKMLQNFQSTETILAVDHVSFNNSTGGQHRKVTFVSPLAVPVPPGTTSVVYANDGVADTAIPQCYFRNSESILPLSAIAAFCVFTGPGVTDPTIPVLNGFNIATISSVGANYTITLTPNATAGDNVAVFISRNNTTSSVIYSFSAGVLTFSAFGVTTFSVLILQI